MSELHERLRLEVERQFTAELGRLFAKDLLLPVLDEATVENEHDPFLAVLRGHSFKVTRTLTPRLHALCHEVQDSLGVDEDVEYFVDSSADLNAMSIARRRKDTPHIVVLNSGLLDRFDDREMRFIVGHELGHIASRNSELMRVIRFIFPEGSTVPTFFADKIETWDRLAELSADRFGYLASQDLDVCAGVFFKLSSGMNTARVAFSPVAYREAMDEILEQFRRSGEYVETSHPINPIRLKALEHFAGSDLCKTAAAGTAMPEDPELKKRMAPLLELLFSKGASPLAQHRRMFVVAGGLLMAGADGELAPSEVEVIVGNLANFTLFPRHLLQEMVEQGDVRTIFEKAVAGVLQRNPAERVPMFHYLVGVATADRRFRKPEVDLLFEVGEKVFQFARKEVAQLIASELREHFVPGFLS